MNQSLEKFVNPKLANFAEQQADFMDMSNQKRLNLLEALQALNCRNQLVLHQLIMHMSLVREEVVTELNTNFHDRVINPVAIRTMDPQQVEEYNIDTLTILADDCIDSIYVLCSLLNKLGIPSQQVWDEVHRSNMAKGFDCIQCGGSGIAVDKAGDEPDCEYCHGTGKLVKRREDGKTLKPDGWQPPNIRRIIVRELARLKGEEDKGLDNGG